MRHRFLSLCPYFAMFPESFAQRWINHLSQPGDVVADPFSGGGTTAFQALLMGRRAFASDINPVAYCLTRAKIRAPTYSGVRRRLEDLEASFRPGAWQRLGRQLPLFFHAAFHPETLAQILYLRDRLKWGASDVDCFTAALALRCLHGESHKSPAYLSNRMPRTISTKPAYSIRYWEERSLVAPRRDAFEVLRNQAEFRFATPPPETRGRAYRIDVRQLPGITRHFPGLARLVITSPPYLDVTSFEEDQWLRLWFLGYESRPTKRRISPDDRHESAAKYWEFIADSWRSLESITAPKADVVIRLGGRGVDAGQLIDGLRRTSSQLTRRVRLVSSEVSQLQGRQTRSFRPETKGCRIEVDCHFRFCH
jgi:hypothetical protein